MRRGGWGGPASQTSAATGYILRDARWCFTVGPQHVLYMVTPCKLHIHTPPPCYPVARACVHRQRLQFRLPAIVNHHWCFTVEPRCVPQRHTKPTSTCPHVRWRVVSAAVARAQHSRTFPQPQRQPWHNTGGCCNIRQPPTHHTRRCKHGAGSNRALHDDTDPALGMLVKPRVTREAAPG